MTQPYTVTYTANNSITDVISKYNLDSNTVEQNPIHIITFDAVDSGSNLSKWGLYFQLSNTNDAVNSSSNLSTVNSGVKSSTPLNPRGLYFRRDCTSAHVTTPVAAPVTTVAAPVAAPVTKLQELLKLMAKIKEQEVKERQRSKLLSGLKASDIAAKDSDIATKDSVMAQLMSKHKDRTA